jgi:large subunit ribosomal protein L9
MKVILTKDVNKVGKAGSMVDVADGYARNYLIARGLALEATAGRLAEVKRKETEDSAREKKLREAAEAARQVIQHKAVHVRASAGENGRLFGSITSSQVAEAIKRQYDVEVDKRDIKLSDPIKQAGAFPFTVQLFRGISVEMTLSVEVE